MNKEIPIPILLQRVIKNLEFLQNSLEIVTVIMSLRTEIKITHF